MMPRGSKKQKFHIHIFPSSFNSRKQNNIRKHLERRRRGGRNYNEIRLDGDLKAKAMFEKIEIQM